MNPKVLSIIVVLSLLCAGCASKTPNLLGPGWVDGSETLGVVYIPPPKGIYVEFSTGRGVRRAEIEHSPGLNLLAGILGSSLGVWAEYAAAVASAPANATVVVNPVAIAAIVLVAPVTGFAVDKIKEAKARKRAQPFLETLGNLAGTDPFFTALQREFELNSELGFAKYKFLMVQGSEYDQWKTDDYFRELGVEKLLLVGTIASFTPAFEVLEVNTAYGVVERSADKPKVLYRNNAIVQSLLRTGLDGASTHDEAVMVATQRKLESLEKLKGRSKSRRFSEYETLVTRNEIIKKYKARKKKWVKEYHAFDKSDRNGDRWLENQAEPFKQELAHTTKEAARIIHLDLARNGVADLSGSTYPPGYKRKMTLREDLNSSVRHVYQATDGVVISINKASRMVPLSASD